MFQYVDFSVTIHPQSDGVFPVSIIGPAGDGDSTFELPLGDSRNHTERVRELRKSVQAGVTRGVTFRTQVKESMSPQEVGQLLFTALFHGKALALLEESRKAIRHDVGLRIKLRIDPAERSLVPLIGLPWELMYQEQRREFLNLSNANPLVRYLDIRRPFAAIPFKPPFRILVLISNPQGVEALDLDHERKLIEQSWGKRLDVQVDFLGKATKSELQRQLGRADYHALHFMGHGDFDQESGRGVLILETEDGFSERISGQALGVLLADEPTLRMVFLNACNTAQATADSENNPFSGVASALVMAGVPVVVAMQFPITDDAAIAFSRKFYELLPECHPLDHVVSEARKEVYLMQADQGAMEWATPAVFMRSPDGMIFESFRLKPLNEAQDEILARLNTKVRRFWIEGKLDKDIPIKPPIELDKKLIPKAVQSKFGADNDDVPAGKTIAALFDEQERSLLILSDPGSGKTTSLLALTQYLIRRYDQDNSQPIPVILFLSSWSGSGLSIEDWAVREVFQKYKISDKLFRSWLNAGRIVLMLDGLDEVSSEKEGRADCVEAINAFSASQISRTSYHGVAVCCRFAEYQQLETRLDLEGAIRLQPLSTRQIHDYLEKFGEAMAGLRTCLEEDPRLLEDARSPLMLGMMSIAFRLDPKRFTDVSESGVSNENSGSRRQLLVTTYLDRVFGQPRTGARNDYSRERIADGLRWLASRLKTHQQTVFLLENLHPTWLHRGWQRILFALINGIMLGLVVAAVMAIVWPASNIIDPAPAEALNADRYWFVITPVWGILAVLWESFMFSLTQKKRLISRPGNNKSLLENKFVLVLAQAVVLYLIWMGLWLLAGVWENGTSDKWGKWLAHAIPGGISVSILVAICTLPNIISNYTGTAEQLRWSWKRAGKGLALGLAVGVLLWAISLLIYTDGADREIVIRLWRYYPPTAGVVGLVFGGLSKQSAKTKTRPNEGVMLSLRNSLLAMLVVGTIIGLAMVPILTWAFPDVKENATVLLVCGGGLASFLWFGGIDVMRHYCLRLILFLTGELPWRLPRFFDQMADLILLQKIGGGYIFQNHLLMDHFTEQVDRENE